MKKFVSIATMATSLFFAPAAFAGGGGKCHFHGSAPAKESVVVGCAKEQVNGLVASAKLEKSWKTAQFDKVETVEGKNTKEWKLTFSNATASDAGKKTLYLFYTVSGNFIAANFTGS